MKKIYCHTKSGKIFAKAINFSNGMAVDFFIRTNHKVSVKWGRWNDNLKIEGVRTSLDGRSLIISVWISYGYYLTYGDAFCKPYVDTAKVSSKAFDELIQL